MVASVAPDMVRSVQGETSQAQAGKASPAARKPSDQPEREIAAGAVAADGDVFCSDALLAQETPRRERVFMGRWVGMFGRAPVIDRERAHACRASGFRHQPAMADNRAGAITAAVKIQQHLRLRSLPGYERPFAGHAVAIDGVTFHIGSHRPGRSDFVEPLRAAPTIRPAAALSPEVRGWRRSRREPRFVLPGKQIIISHWPASNKKLRPAFGGRLAAREPVWDGEGWGCDRVAGS